MRRGLIWERCKTKGLGGLTPLGREFTQDEMQELTDETVAKALWHFKHDVLMRHKWDYHRGASLRTYFIGQCLIRFANIYRRWWGNEVRAGRVMLAEDPHLTKNEPRVGVGRGDGPGLRDGHGRAGHGEGPPGAEGDGAQCSRPVPGGDSDSVAGQREGRRADDR